LFLVFSGFVSLGGLSQILTGILLLAILYSLTDFAWLISAFVMMRRMRWFFLSIFIIYAWMTPGQAAATIPDFEAWLPTIEGMISGTMRALSLSLILMAVNLLLRCTSRRQLIMAIYWLTVPLRLIGISPERISIRIALVIEALGEVREIVSVSFKEVRGKITSLDNIGDFAARVFHKVTSNADRAPNRAITFHDYNAPQAIQWLFPVTLWVIFISTELLSRNL